ncbi:hypothetical protein BDB01DRAFT_793479 [Pilobolus umbonatus]|nr:hypothetical protein BDB01DRAFT_793479 [Pilobolus umbonatus]
MTNEDLFNMFFGSGMRTSFNSQDTFRQRQDFLRQQQRRQQQTDNSILPFIPLILIGVLAIVAALFSIEGDPVYSFQPSPPLSSYRTTKSNYIPYYVNPSVFNDIKKNPFKFNKLERQIELDYLGELRSRCQQEQRYRSNLLAEADGILFGIVGRNEKAYKEAQRYEMKNCDQLKKLAGKIRY